jgi:hypothetical protein
VLFRLESQILRESAYGVRGSGLRELMTTTLIALPSSDVATASTIWISGFYDATVTWILERGGG